MKDALRAVGDDGFHASRLNRLESTQSALEEAGVDALILSLGADLPWLSGYEAMPLERLTALVVRRGVAPVLFVPELEAPRVRHYAELFELRPWKEGSNPYEMIGSLLSKADLVGVSDRMWASALLELQNTCPNSRFISASGLLKGLRGQKDSLELLMLARAAHITDRVADQLLAGEIAVLGRSEAEVSDELSSRLVAEGLAKVNFAIVGSGPNSASPHHEAGDRIISIGDAVVCDFGGVFRLGEEPGYCSDITRTIGVGDLGGEFVELYGVLSRAQTKARDEMSSALSGAELDAIARNVIEASGYGEFFVHRTGHGIGIEEHEDPYIASTNSTLLGAYAAFSIEPGIYIPGKFGARIEDICVVGEHMGVSLNRASRELTILS